jgi:hypothetical protein
VKLDFEVTGRLEVPAVDQIPQIMLRVHPMDLTSDDRHNMQLNLAHTPTPTINERLSFPFPFPPTFELA